MSKSHDFTVSIKNWVYTARVGERGSLFVSTNRGHIVVCESYNHEPEFAGLYATAAWQLGTADERASLEQAEAEAIVADEVAGHERFCLEQIEDGEICAATGKTL